MESLLAPSTAHRAIAVAPKPLADFKYAFGTAGFQALLSVVLSAVRLAVIRSTVTTNQSPASEAGMRSWVPICGCVSSMST